MCNTSGVMSTAGVSLMQKLGNLNFGENGYSESISLYAGNDKPGTVNDYGTSGRVGTLSSGLRTALGGDNRTIDPGESPLGDQVLSLLEHIR